MNFVVGKERSGTTLLQIMLNAHPNIVAPPESRFIILLQPWYGYVRKWTERNIKDFCRDIFKEPLFRNRWRLKQDDLEATLMPLREQLTYPLLCKIVFYLFAPEGKEVKLFFDKNPVYYYFLPELEKLFPEAKFIHIVRDYRDNMSSHKRVFNLQDAGDLAYKWVKVNSLIEDRKRGLASRYLTIKYESLVSKPEESMKETCSFLGLPYSENMSDQTKNIYPSFTEMNKPRFLELHGSLLQPINTSHVGEWKQKLKPDEVARAEAIAGDYGNKMYGYGKTGTNAKVGNIAITKMRYAAIKQLYKVVMKRLWLYYYVKRKLWPDF